MKDVLYASNIALSRHPTKSSAYIIFYKVDGVLNTDPLIFVGSEVQGRHVTPNSHARLKFSISHQPCGYNVLISEAQKLHGIKPTFESHPSSGTQRSDQHRLRCHKHKKRRNEDTVNNNTGNDKCCRRLHSEVSGLLLNVDVTPSVVRVDARFAATDAAAETEKPHSV